jgi:hypothetical protein
MTHLRRMTNGARACCTGRDLVQFSQLDGDCALNGFKRSRLRCVFEPGVFQFGRLDSEGLSILDVYMRCNRN